MTIRGLKPLRLDRMVRLAVAFDEVATTDTFELPDKLDDLSDDELIALRDKAIGMFHQLYNGGEANLSKEDLDVLKGLKAAADEVGSEIEKRYEASAATRDEAAKLAEELMPKPVEPDPAVVPLEPVMSDESEVEVDVEPEIAQAAAAQTQALSGVIVPATTMRGKKLVMPAGGRKNAKAVAMATATPVSPVRVAPGAGYGAYATGAAISMDDLADLFTKSVRGLSSAAPETARMSGQHYSQRFPVATIVREFDDRLRVTSDDPSAIEAAIAYATDESRLPGNSLVAAGGWCAPSETIYDLCELESTEGIFSIPEIGASRGGVRNTLGPDWSSFFTGTGFCFTEADDVAGAYGTNEVQTLTQGGTGLTSFTLSFGGFTTTAIPQAADGTAVQAALSALPSIGVGNVTVTGASGGPYTVTFVGLLANTNVAQLTATPTGGSGTVTPATTTQGGSGTSSKPCITVPCPSFVDTRLGVCGICVNSGILLDRAFPELVQRYVRGVVAAHMHRVSYQVLQTIVTASTAVTFASESATRNAAVAPLLSSIELRVEAIKNRYRMRRGQSLEAVFPIWVRGLMRADLSRQLGVTDKYAVTDAMIAAWFASRGVNAQFVYNFNGLAASPLVWPSSVSFLLYPAGTWVKLAGDVITLENLHDSSLNASNNFQAIFSEEAYAVMRNCHVSEYVTVPVCPSGATQGGIDVLCPA